MKDSILVQHLKMQFQNKTVLQDIDLKISKGEIFGLLGPSGAGKTTLIKILTGQLRQTSGTAQILGANTMELDHTTYTQIGMVLDQAGLYDRLSCYDNLALFAEIYKIPKTQIAKVLEKVDLQKSIKLPVSKLSKGMKQRLVLARAIMHKPKLLFLDEPTSALDPATARYIHELILEEKAKGTTIFLTTHNMEEASKLCDHVALLNEGKVMEYGTPQELCKRYNKQEQIEVQLTNGEVCVLKNQPETGNIVKEYFEKGLLTSIHSLEPNLETVFMEITGRKLV